MRVIVWLFVIAVVGLVVTETLSAVLTRDAAEHRVIKSSEGTAPSRAGPVFEQ